MAHTIIEMLQDFRTRVRARRKVNESFAQEGEDLVLSRLFESLHPGQRFYVDVGAHHPFRFSNTMHFYLAGWRGINIEPNPALSLLFTKYRPRDINLCAGVSDCSGTLKYWKFNEPALNTFDSETMEKILREHREYVLNGSEEIPVFTLAEILDRHMPAGTGIDFLSVDVEGFDLKVLKSNNWPKYRPKVVLFEDRGLTLDGLSSSAGHQYLTSLGYTAYAKTINTLFYVDPRALAHW